MREGVELAVKLIEETCPDRYFSRNTEPNGGASAPKLSKQSKCGAQSSGFPFFRFIPLKTS